MVNKFAIGTACACLAVVSFNANTALVSRLGGLAYYDDVADLTWLADANYAQTSGYDADGLMFWEDAMVWGTALDVAGVTGWRLPDTLQPDTSCDSQSDGVSSGYNCTGSEMGNLYYIALGNFMFSLTNTGPFSNVQLGGYWSATDFAPHTTNVWSFAMFNGAQVWSPKTQVVSYAWAVHDGDVGLIPIPAAVWLFASGLIGLIGIARRKKS